MSIDDENDGGLADLVAELGDVDESGPEASLNERTIDDNNGGRIELNEDEYDKK